MKITDAMVEAALDEYYGCKKDETWRSVIRTENQDSEMADMRGALEAAMRAAEEETREGTE